LRLLVRSVPRFGGCRRKPLVTALKGSGLQLRDPSTPHGRSVPRLAVTKAEAAVALGVSIDSFERHVQPELRCVRRGRLRLFDVRELERWLEENGVRSFV
jgi:hypothetical protein